MSKGAAIFVIVGAVCIVAVVASVPDFPMEALVMAAGLGFVYFLPSIIAANREHPYVAAVFFANLIFGATGLGWCVCFVWAFMTRRDPMPVVPVRPPQQAAPAPPALPESSTDAEPRVYVIE